MKPKHKDLRRKPWHKTYSRIWSRCKDPKSHTYKNYKDREFSITCKELKEIWYRDKAFLMDFPSIDRIDNKKGYTLDNCQYIEKRDNKHTRPVKQLTQDGELIKIWETTREAENALKLNNICIVCQGKGKTCGGWRWEYYEKS